MRVFFTNLGCKLNQAENDRLAGEFLAAGHHLAATLAEADLHVVNSCTVTATAARDSRKAARAGARLAASAAPAAPRAPRTVLTGCYATAAPEEAAHLAGVDLVVANADKGRLLDRVHAAFPEQARRAEHRQAPLPANAAQPEPTRTLQPAPAGATDSKPPVATPPAPARAAEREPTRTAEPAPAGAVLSEPAPGVIAELAPTAAAAARHFPAPAPGATRALVKVEDGCDMRCSFCIIPATRGRHRSRPADEVAAEVHAWLAAGYREVVVTGVQISAWRGVAGRAPAAGLAGLVRRLLAELPAAPLAARLRLTSIAPWELDQELLDLWADPRLCRHLHLSLQSGATATLRRMRRPYSAATYERRVAAARAAIPGVAISTDVIVGFPGESDAEFEESLATVAGLGFARIHVFPFSPRPGTAAADLPGAVPDALLRLRMKRMLAAAETAEHAFRIENLGRRATVLWEAPRHHRPQGLTDNYIRVFSHIPPPIGHDPATTSRVPPATGHDPLTTSRVQPATGHDPATTSRVPQATGHDRATTNHVSAAADPLWNRLTEVELTGLVDGGMTCRPAAASTPECRSAAAALHSTG